MPVSRFPHPTDCKLELVRSLEVLANIIASTECFAAKVTFKLHGLCITLHMTAQGIKPGEIGATEAFECPVALLRAVIVEL